MAEVQLNDILGRQICYVLLCTFCCLFYFKTWQYFLALTSGLCEVGGLAGLAGGGQLNHYLGVIYLAV